MVVGFVVCCIVLSILPIVGGPVGVLCCLVGRRGECGVCDHVVVYRMGFGAAFLLFRLTFLLGVSFALTIRE